MDLRYAVPAWISGVGRGIPHAGRVQTDIGIPAMPVPASGHFHLSLRPCPGWREDWGSLASEDKALHPFHASKPSVPGADLGIEEGEPG